MSKHLSSGTSCHSIPLHLQTRAMETAVGAFGGSVWHDGDAELPLMTEVSAGKFSTAHPAVSSRGTVPFVAFELCREHLGDRDQLVYLVP